VKPGEKIIDDPLTWEDQLANDGILAAIFQEWFEEVNRL
jgi:hypothetical protein